MNFNFRHLIVLSTVFLTTSLHAAIKKENVSYKQGKTQLEGVMVYDDAVKGPRPAVIVVHDWMGIGDYSIMRAEQLAGMGYVAFAADIYGKGIHPKDQTEAGQFAGKYKSDRKLLRERAKAAFDTVSKNSMVQKNKIAVVGYCFGGTTALEMGRAGLPLAGILSFHGGLDSPKPEDGKNIKSKVWIAHGAVDPFVSKSDLEAFTKEMNDAKVDYQFIAYSGAVHAFTQKNAGTDASKGAAYNEVADRRSFEAMKLFLTEIFQ